MPSQLSEGTQRKHHILPSPMAQCGRTYTHTMTLPPHIEHTHAYGDIQSYSLRDFQINLTRTFVVWHLGHFIALFVSEVPTCNQSKGYRITLYDLICISVQTRLVVVQDTLKNQLNTATEVFLLLATARTKSVKGCRVEYVAQPPLISYTCTNTPDNH